MRKLVVLVVLAMVVVLAVEAIDISDADAKRKKKRRPPAPPAIPAPPDYNFVFCAADSTCNGTPSADLMVGAAGNEVLLGAAGNDIYMDSAGSDRYADASTSNDLYGGFKDGNFFEEFIVDGGGFDRVDLSADHRSDQFVFFKSDYDSDGAQDDLQIFELNPSHDDNIYVLNHFGSGQIEYIKFSDKTLSGANLPLL